MKYFVALTLGSTLAAANLDGVVNIHAPSTPGQDGGRCHAFGTGGGSLFSDDGWTWRRGAALPRRGLAPDVIHMGGRYLLYVAANIGAEPKAAINLLTNKTLDPKPPDDQWEEGGVTASSDGIEDCNAIDPGLFLDPNDDGVSRGLTLKKGANIIRAAIVNGGAATGFCARFLDAKHQPVTGIAISLRDTRP